MPWCDSCAKYYAPNAMRPDGTCPTCGRSLATSGSLRAEARALGVDDPTVVKKADGTPKAPWHFKVMVVAVSIYLLWRLVQGIEWVVHRL